MSSQISLMLKTRQTSEMIRNGVSVAIVGEPNVGKSSLMNLLGKFAF